MTLGIPKPERRRRRTCRAETTWQRRERRRRRRLQRAARWTQLEATRRAGAMERPISAPGPDYLTGEFYADVKRYSRLRMPPRQTRELLIRRAGGRVPLFEIYAIDERRWWYLTTEPLRAR